MDNTETYKEIALPNGGTISMDRLAYESYSGAGAAYHKKNWKVTLDFESDKKIETAAIDKCNETILYR